MRKFLLTLCAFAVLGSTSTAFAGKRNPAGRYDVQVLDVYDGDTFYINWPGLPAELQPLKVRVRGIDTPERAGKCPSERAKASQARAITIDALRRSSGYVTIGDLQWDKYGGRIDADVYLGPNKTSLVSILAASGLARPYTGGQRASWC